MDVDDTPESQPDVASHDSQEEEELDERTSHKLLLCGQCRHKGPRASRAADRVAKSRKQKVALPGLPCTPIDR